MLRLLAVIGAACVLAAGVASAQSKLSVSKAETRDVGPVASAPDAAGFRDPAWKSVESRYRGLVKDMKREIGLMTQLRDAQALLLAHNKGREALGEEMAALSQAPCAHAEMRVWCAALPATFGRSR